MKKNKNKSHKYINSNLSKQNIKDYIPKCSYLGCNDEAERGSYCYFHYSWEHAYSK